MLLAFIIIFFFFCFFFQAEDGIRDLVRSRGLGDVYKRQVLSGNRNFEARIHPNLKANFLASPPLVVAYALAGNVMVDLMLSLIHI